MIDIDKNLFTQVLEQLPVGTLIIDAGVADWPVVHVNAIVGQLLGLDAVSLLGVPWARLLSDPEELSPQRERLLANPSLAVRHLRQRWQSRSGEPVDMTLQVSPLFVRPGQPAYWLLSVDADPRSTEFAGEDTLRLALHDAQQQLRQVDRNDGVTGLFNRQGFLEVLRRDGALAGREQRRVGIIVFEVDALDRYRDLYGRHAADSCLRKVAHAISGALRRGGDLAARISDSRFAALVGSAEDAHVRQFAERIALRVRELAIHHPRSPAGRYVTVSIGICSEVPPADAADLLDKAEAELMQPQSLGGQLLGAG
ncbi:MAG: diguanylate cyclase [Gammaproteobacteria bacterium]|nr:diguanylate cyclase [Gammaproteobacteria bacterium]